MTEISALGMLVRGRVRTPPKVVNSVGSTTRRTLKIHGTLAAVVSMLNGMISNQDPTSQDVRTPSPAAFKQ